VVRHPAGLAQGEPGQAAPLTPEQVRHLLSAAGRDAVALASTLDLTTGSRLRDAETLRAAAGPELGPLALEQAVLKRRARSKHPEGHRLWWTAEALEQASSHPVAQHRAQRFAGAERVLDLGCSVGGDLLPLAKVVPAVGVDLDQTRLLLAAENARVLRLSVQLVRADVTRLTPSGAVFADPARRAGGRRVFDPRAYSPPLDLVLRWLPRLTALGIKVAPGIDYDALPPEVEVEVVSLRGEVKEAVLWAAGARRGFRRTATLLPAGDVLTDALVAEVTVRPPGRFLLEPDGAVVRAHLVAQIAAQVDGWLLDSTIAYVAAAAAVPTPFGRWYEVLETLPFGLKPLRERLRTYDAGPLVVKKRGTAVEPETLRKQLKLTGSREVTVVLTRAAGRQIVLIVQPLASMPSLTPDPF
jgi:SAM-dependent methyltransferase